MRGSVLWGDRTPASGQMSTLDAALAFERADDLAPPRALGVVAARCSRLRAASCSWRADPIAVIGPVNAKRPSASTTSAPGTSRRVRRWSTTARPLTVSGRAGSPSAGAPRARWEDRAAARRRLARPGRLERSLAPALQQRGNSTAASWRTRTWRWSPASITRRAARRDRLLAADDHVEQRVARQVEVADAAADAASPAAARRTRRPRRRAGGSRPPPMQRRRQRRPRRSSRRAAGRPARTSRPAARSRAAPRRRRC